MLCSSSLLKHHLCLSLFYSLLLSACINLISSLVILPFFKFWELHGPDNHHILWRQIESWQCSLGKVTFDAVCLKSNKQRGTRQLSATGKPTTVFFTSQLFCSLEAIVQKWNNNNVSVLKPVHPSVANLWFVGLLGGVAGKDILYLCLTF